MTTPQLAKLTPPRLAKVYNRTRLFKQLDEERDKPVIWISAPAGSGKTTLVASYLKEKKIKPLWYQIDEGDSDIASFFYYMGSLGKQAAPRKKADLPLLTPEYLLGLPIFTRNFFRELFSRIKKGGVLVLDNYQDAGSEATLNDILPLALNEIPEGVTAIIISREAPPESLARLQVSHAMAVVDWNAIQLELEESLAIGRLHAGKTDLSDDFLTQLHEVTDGWMAGLVLSVERAGDIVLPDSLKDEGNRQLIFNYFAGEIFQRLQHEEQGFLLQTAFLDEIRSEDARMLTDDAHAETMLDTLCARNYFTYRRALNGNTYVYHPLFKDFLTSTAKTKLSANELQELQVKSAALLESSNRPEEAANLYIDLQDWSKLAHIVVTHAQALMMQGKWQTLKHWFAALPEEVVKNEPWLICWKGMCHIALNPKITRDYLEKAFYLFNKESDVTGQLISFCSIVDTYIYERGEMQTLDSWLDAVKELVSSLDDYVSSELGIRVTCAMFMALIYRQPDHPDVSLWEKRASAIVLSDADPRLRISIGNHLVLYYMWWISDKAKAEIIVRALQPIVESGKAPPLARITWQMIEAGYHWMVTGSGESAQSAQKGLDIGEATGVHILDVYILTHAVFSSLCHRDREAVAHYLDKMTPLIEQHRYMDTSWYYFLYGWGEIAKEEYESAFQYAEKALDHSLKSGRPFMIANAYIEYATLLHRRGDKEKAADYIERALQIGQGMHSATIIHLAEFARMEFEINEHGKQADIKQVKKCLELGKKAGELSISWFSPKTLLSFYTLALELNLEREYVLERIQKAGFVPLDYHSVPMDWPFPIKITTLGAFKLVLNDEPVVFKGKAQKKPIELLKALIAYGGQDINAQHLAESLWPDAEGDAAYQSFTMTLKRLRELLGKKEALVLTEGKLTLDKNYAWVDVWAMEQGIKAENAEQLQQAMDLYQGSFLEGEDDAWAISPREQWRNKLINLVTQLGNEYEKQQSWQNAIKIYQQGLEVDPIAERFYQGMMRCYAEMGERSEALKSYETCADKLQNQLGVAPSATTVEFYNTLREE